MSKKISAGKVGIVITDTHISGTVRRIANMFRALSLRNPSGYHLIVPEELYQWLKRADFLLEECPNVHRLRVRSRADSKRWENESLTFEDMGRFMTLWNFRNQAARIIKHENIRILQCVLDSVYIFGLRPVPGVVQIASLVSVLRRHHDKSRPIGRMLHFCLQRYDLIECIGPQIRQRTLQQGFSASKVFCAPNSFVDVQRYKPEKKNSNEVVFAARLHDFKNPDLYLNAIVKAYEQCPEAEFHLLGAGPMRVRTERRLRTLGLMGRVHFGFNWGTSTVLNRSSINVQLQNEDNYPSQSLLEGMAAGNAIIATDVGLTRKLVDEDNGILIPLADTDALAEAMIWMLEHPDKTLMMGRRSRERLLREHTLGGYLDYMMSVYDRASLLLREKEALIKRAV